MSNYIDRLREQIGKTPIILVGASILARDEHGRVLLQYKCETDNWGLPGGTMRLGETIKETACRKLYEETGIKADNLKLTDIFSGEDFYDINPDGDCTYNLIVLYEAFGVSDELIIENEKKSLKVEYLYPEEVSNLELRSMKILNRIGIFSEDYIS